eukprot:527791-Pelagomonas_calceolata.AAC.11
MPPGDFWDAGTSALNLSQLWYARYQLSSEPHHPQALAGASSGGAGSHAYLAVPAAPAVHDPCNLQFHEPYAHGVWHAMASMVSGVQSTLYTKE